MGVGRRKLVPFWVLALALACSQHTGKIQSVQLSQASWGDIFIPPMLWTQVRSEVQSFLCLGPGKLKVSVRGSCHAAQPGDFKWSLT